MELRALSLSMKYGILFYCYLLPYNTSLTPNLENRIVIVLLPIPPNPQTGYLEILHPVKKCKYSGRIKPRRITAKK